MTYGPYCGHLLTTIRSGGCGGEGEIAGCEECDTVYEFHGGGMTMSAHPEIQQGESFKAYFYRAAKERKVFKIEHGKNAGKWTWNPEAGIFYNPNSVTVCATKEEAESGLRGWLQGLHDQLPWPTCPLCGKKPQEPYGFGADNFRCKKCNTFYGHSGVWTKGGEPI